MSGVLAIVGRPNVGKSALFNRLAGRRIAIVHDQPGVTRDRISAEVEWQGRSFTLIDTGGIGLRRGEKVEDVIVRAALEQVDLAIQSASAILFVVNVQEGLVALDQEVAVRLREAGKPVLLVVNKSDNDLSAAEAVDFARLGFEKSFPVSAIHGRGVEALMRAAVEFLPEESASDPGAAIPSDGAADSGDEAEGDAGQDSEALGTRRSRDARDYSKDPLRLAIVGRPNVGKSSLINALTQSTRVVVSSIPGTTRDAVDVPFEVETEGRRERYVLVDTAGVRKRKSVDTSVEFFSVKRTEDAVSRCDIAILVLDAGDGILEQDKKIGALITEARRACIVVVNKWDLVSESVHEARVGEMERRNRRGRNPGNQILMTTLGEFGRWVQEKLFFLDYAPVIFTSAASGFHLDRLLEAVRYVGAQLKQEIPTAVLNRTLHDAVTRRQPVSKTGELLKFYYATQIGHAPPKFVLFFNRSDLLNRAYEKHLSDSLRTAFGYEGCPIVLIPRARPKTIESVRRPRREDGDGRRGRKGGRGRGRKPGPNSGAVGPGAKAKGLDGRRDGQTVSGLGGGKSRASGQRGRSVRSVKRSPRAGAKRRVR
ncbi:MAG: ribosome biogenesis GTPase Der [Limisphaerales bacterium]